MVISLMVRMSVDGNLIRMESSLSMEFPAEASLAIIGERMLRAFSFSDWILGLIIIGVIIQTPDRKNLMGAGCPQSDGGVIIVAGWGFGLSCLKVFMMFFLCLCWFERSCFLFLFSPTRGCIDVERDGFFFGFHRNVHRFRVRRLMQRKQSVFSASCVGSVIMMSSPGEGSPGVLLVGLSWGLSWPGEFPGDLMTCSGGWPGDLICPAVSFKEEVISFSCVGESCVVPLRGFRLLASHLSRLGPVKPFWYINSFSPFSEATVCSSVAADSQKNQWGPGGVRTFCVMAGCFVHAGRSRGLVLSVGEVICGPL